MSPVAADAMITLDRPPSLSAEQPAQDVHADYVLPSVSEAKKKFEQQPSVPSPKASPRRVPKPAVPVETPTSPQVTRRVPKPTVPVEARTSPQVVRRVPKPMVPVEAPTSPQVVRRVPKPTVPVEIQTTEDIYPQPSATAQLPKRPQTDQTLDVRCILSWL